MDDLLKGLRGELAIDCMCAARSSDECGCEAMWPDQFTYRAADEIERLQSDLTKSAEREAELVAKVERLERELQDMKHGAVDFKETIDLPAGFKHTIKYQCDTIPLTDEQFADYMATPCGIGSWVRMKLVQLTEAQQLAADRLVQMEQLQKDVRKLSAIIMLANPEGSDKYEFAYLTKALMDGPEFCEKLDAAMKETPHD